MEKKMETIMIYWGDIGIMEKKMETTMVYWGDIGIMVEGFRRSFSIHTEDANSDPACGFRCWVPPPTNSDHYG